MIAPAIRSAPPRPRRVAVVVDTSTAFGRGILRGIHEYLADQGCRWNVTISGYVGAGARWSAPRRLVDGVIARVDSPAMARVIERVGCPTVALDGAGWLAAAATIGVDQASVARIAADHLADSAHEHVAFVGRYGHPASDSLQRYFAREMGRRGRSVACLAVGTARRGFASRRLVDWLRRLPKPVGVFACDDAVGRTVIASCVAAGLRVPEDVGVLGLHDDDLVVPGQPTLSSIATDSRAAGRLAADLLARRFAGGRPAAGNRMVSPLGIVVRESTDGIAVRDPVVAAAARFIRTHAHRGIRVGDVVAATHLGRRALTQRFLRVVGRTPHDEIRRMQLQRVESLLRDSDLPLAAVAGRCGFKHPEYMTAVFTRFHGVPPRDWRRTMRSEMPRAGGLHTRNVRGPEKTC